MTSGSRSAAPRSVTRDEGSTSDEVVENALEDVQAFWSRTYEGLYGEPYEPIQGGFWPYGPNTEQPPCGDPLPSLQRDRGQRVLLPDGGSHRLG